MTRPLAGVDAQVLDLLAHVVAIGKHRGTRRKPLWDAKDLVRVANTWLAPRIKMPADAAALILHDRRRALIAERQVRLLARQVAALQDQIRNVA